MSKARLVITAVVIEGRSQSEVAREYGVSQSWISRLVSRYHREGDAAFEPRSRRPHTSPRRLPQSTVDLIIELRHTLAGKGLDNGPHTIAWHLQHHHQRQVSAASISRHLHAAGLVEPSPQKRPKSSYIRFAAEQPNQRWQADFTHWWLPDGTHVEILCWIDDHSRYALSVTAQSIKGLGHRLRAMGGKDEDGPRLVESLLDGADPVIWLNDRANQSQRDEQRGVALLMKGLFAAVRNPQAYELESCGPCPNLMPSTRCPRFIADWIAQSQLYCELTTIDNLPRRSSLRWRRRRSKGGIDA